MVGWGTHTIVWYYLFEDSDGDVAGAENYVYSRGIGALNIVHVVGWVACLWPL